MRACEERSDKLRRHVYAASNTMCTPLSRLAWPVVAAHCTSTIGGDLNLFAPCVSSCVQTTTAYSDSCASCFGGVGVCVATFCSSVCGGTSISLECESCAFSNCNAAFEKCSGWDASVPPSTDTSIDGLCGDEAAWAPCPIGQFRSQPSEECVEVQSRIHEEAALDVMRRISRFYGATGASTNGTIRDTHLMDAECARELSSLTNSPFKRKDLIDRAYNGTAADAVPFIDGPLIISHAGAASALSQRTQGRAKEGFFWQTDTFVPETWGEHGPTAKSSGTNAHFHARQMAAAAWPVFTQR